MERTGYSKILSVLLCCVVLLAITGCSPKTPAHKPTIAVDLGEKYNTPDGMVLDADNTILLNIPNFNDDSHPAVVLRISEDNTIEEVCTLPAHPETGKVGPLGIDVGPDGNLYIADNQGMFDHPEGVSRLLRVNMKDGKAVSVDTVATGMRMANAVSCFGDSVYITETSLDPDAVPMPSGVYRFKYSEMTPKPEGIGGAPIVVKTGDVNDPHLIVHFTTTADDWTATVGANGLAFDADGNMYVCNFGEASLLKFTFDENGKTSAPTVIAKGDPIKSTDGMKVHPTTGEIYIADFVGNAVHKVDPKTGKVTTIWCNENNSGGIDGLLDKPSEVCIRGNKVYVSNIDLTLDGNDHNAPHTISVIELQE
jgi:sugar lactone lactonase YvrE